MLRTEWPFCNHKNDENEIYVYNEPTSEQTNKQNSIRPCFWKGQPNWPQFYVFGSLCLSFDCISPLLYIKRKHTHVHVRFDLGTPIYHRIHAIRMTTTTLYRLVEECAHDTFVCWPLVSVCNVHLFV